MTPGGGARAPRVVVTDQAFGQVRHERAVAASFGAEFAEYHCITEAETIEALAGADVAFVNFAPMTRGALAALRPGATVIRYGIGHDNVDLAAARDLGVQVAHVPDYGTGTVADHAVACLLALLRRLPAYDLAIRERGWCAPADVGPLPSFPATTVGLIGTGRIGRAVADRLRAFGFRVLASDPYADPAPTFELVELPELLAQAHAISLHAPVTPGTRGLISRARLARMRPGAVLVNTSRGALVDTGALADALRSGHLAGAALDVVDPEPLPPDHPLRGAPGVLLTPHAAFYSTESLDALQRLAADEAARALAGEALRRRVA
ncbi:C-terminal binding protein [Streptomyces radicis]|uniref:C-terminal binding protein n=1 Tax=Streptomyces radicis TaxID=1750517 RepID=A0A3A9W492_9ACTN|nr:C-terminal binding protein [Streptomyces radicis]RKN07572.1 C-terminal binding protein [Streptomyces radicis]RKN13703.1 C-terminal binding protein [Streptomyces radicis]